MRTRRLFVPLLEFNCKGTANNRYMQINTVEKRLHRKSFSFKKLDMKYKCGKVEKCTHLFIGTPCQSGNCEAKEM